MKLFLLLISSYCFLLQAQSQIILTAAGTTAGPSGGDGQPFSKATFGNPGYMIYDKAGNLFIIEVYGGRIRKVDPVSGIITTLISDLYNPRGIAFDPQEQNMYIAANACIYKLNMETKVLSVFAGIPGESCNTSICGDNIPALSAKFGSTTGVAVDSVGNVYVADYAGSRIRRIDITTRIISTYAGGANCNCVGYGDNGPANKATLLFPTAVSFDNQGNLLIADGGLHNIRKVDSKTGIISTIAGLSTPGARGYSGDGGAAVNAKLASPSGISIDQNDNLYISDAGNHRIRKVDKAGIITTIAGNGNAGYSGDCGPADKARLNNPVHAVVTPNGSVLIADFDNNVIREVINNAPNVITAPANSLCVKSTLKLENAATGGAWQSSNTTVATVSADGVVTGLSQGQVTISYFVSNGCNNNSSTATLTVYSVPVVEEIEGASTVCEGATTRLNNAVAGGAWSSSNSSVASVGSDGTVTGVAGGSAWIKYTLSNGSCSNADSVEIRVSPLPKPQPTTGDTSICINGTTTLANTNAGGTWSISNAGIAQIDPNSGIINGRSAGNAIVTYTVTNSCGSAAVQIGLIVHPLPYFSLGNDTSICVNSSLLLQSPINNVSNTWEDGSTTATHSVSLPGNYWLRITDANGCSHADTVNIQDKPLPAVYLGNDTVLCNDQALTLQVNDNSIETYKWHDGTGLPSFVVKEPGKFYVTVTGNNGCSNSDTINISYANSPVVDLGNGGVICPNSPVIIDPQLSNVSYLWQDGSTGPTYTVTAPGVYSLTATNFCGPTTASVEFKEGLCRLLIPGAFTPNSDGLNDLFRVKYTEFIRTFRLTVFNRWGLKVFETTDPTRGWNGKYKNRDQEPGSYVWVITYTDLGGKTENAKGSVLLIR